MKKKYNDSCQSMVALRKKTTQAFVAAYHKPRLSTHSEAHAGVLLHSVRTNPLPRLSLTPPSSVPESPAGLGDTGRTVLAGFYRTLNAPWGCTPLAPSGACCPDKLSSLCPFDPPASRARTACSFYGVHRLFCPLSLQQTSGTE